MSSNFQMSGVPSGGLSGKGWSRQFSESETFSTFGGKVNKNVSA